MKPDVSTLPQPAAIEQALRTSAILETVLCEEEWLRCSRYDPLFAPDLRLGMIDNGAGDHLILLFTEQGTLIKGFDHESPFSPYAQETFQVYPGIYDTTPPALLRLLDEPAFEGDHATFCLWYRADGTHWEEGQIINPDGDNDGKAFLLGMIHDKAESFVEWAKFYYEREIDLDTVRDVYKGHALTAEHIARLHPQRAVEQVMREIAPLLTRFPTGSPDGV